MAERRRLYGDDAALQHVLELSQVTNVPVHATQRDNKNIGDPIVIPLGYNLSKVSTGSTRQATAAIATASYNTADYHHRQHHRQHRHRDHTQLHKGGRQDSY